MAQAVNANKKPALEINIYVLSLLPEETTG